MVGTFKQVPEQPLYIVCAVFGFSKFLDNYNKLHSISHMGFNNFPQNSYYLYNNGNYTYIFMYCIII